MNKNKKKYKVGTRYKTPHTTTSYFFTHTHKKQQQEIYTRTHIHVHVFRCHRASMRDGNHVIRIPVLNTNKPKQTSHIQSLPLFAPRTHFPMGKRGTPFAESS